ncbi:MAG: hypothetical protein CMM93_06745 [Rickettsiales bacterium]|nr:hypothetical protein [Rickettsiales bacterium]
MRTYSRKKDDGSNESFKEIVERVTNGFTSIVKDRINELNPKAKGVNYDNLAKKFASMMHDFRGTPPGRGFWAMGTKLVHEKKMALSLVNCTFISSSNIEKVQAGFFAYTMDVLMLGVGVGFDDRGAGLLKVKIPTKEKVKHVVADSREGWVEAMRVLIQSYMDGNESYEFDYSKIRPKGIILKTFGGTSSGPDPLIKGMNQVRDLLNKATSFDSLLICDINNIIATIVIAGNVRRSSQIFLSKNKECIQFKNYENEKYAYRAAWGWSSNNSMIIEDMDYYDQVIDEIKSGVIKNGEPGIFNLNNVRKYGLTSRGPLDQEDDCDGTNPCGEVSLKGSHEVGSLEKFSAGGETCNLFEFHLNNYKYETLDEAIAQLKADLELGVFYTKAVTLIEPHWETTRLIQNEKRRIGLSFTGIYTFLARYFDNNISRFAPILEELYDCVKEYDVSVSKLLGVTQSVKVTTVKPSGTMTLCGGGFAAGMHASAAKWFIRNIRISNEMKSALKVLNDKGYRVEPCVHQPEVTSVISFPCKSQEGEITKRDITIEGQFELLSCMQSHWSDNQVSCTITFTDKEADRIPDLLKKYKNSIKSVSLLKLNTTYYPQSPEIEITEEQYNKMISEIEPLEYEDFINSTDREEEKDLYCSGDKCMIR